MLVNELDTCVTKFNQLWKAGLTAHLDLDTHAGNAWVGLRLVLGQEPPGPLHTHVPPIYSRNSPSRQRRRARRAAARRATNVAEVVNTEPEQGSKVNDDVNEVVIDKVEPAAEIASDITNEETLDENVEKDIVTDVVIDEVEPAAEIASELTKEETVDENVDREAQIDISMLETDAIQEAVDSSVVDNVDVKTVPPLVTIHATAI